MSEVKLSLLAGKLRELRGIKSLYLVEKESGIYRGTLKKYEAGLLIPERPMLSKLAHYYKIDVSSLLNLIWDDLYPVGSSDRVAIIAWALKAQSTSPS